MVNPVYGLPGAKMNKRLSHLSWKTLEGETVYDTRIFKLNQVKRLSPDGETVSFVQLDAPNWITVIPELSASNGEREFLVVQQYRHGNERIGMEFPAGTMEPGEQPAVSAARELLEETGYTASEFVELSAVSPNPAFMNNTTYTFLARNLEKTADLSLDRYEYLDVHQVSFSLLRQSMGRAPYDSAITAQAWYFYLRHIGEI